MEEIWKDIEDFPGYQVSNLGRVRSWLNNKYGIGNTFRILSPAIDDRTGYLKYSLWKNNKGYTKSIHKLVANAFLDRPNISCPDIDHIDTNKLNNRVDNLQWVTRSENIKRAYEKGLRKPTKPFTSHRVRIIETGEIFESLSDCAKAIGGKENTISMCLSDKYSRKTHKGYHFEYVDKEKVRKPFLYDFQMDAVNRMFSGCILNGGTGSGKSRSGLFYYFKEMGGWIDEYGYKPMKLNPKDLYIITTAKKKNSLEWVGELSHFLLSTNEEQTKRYGNKIIIDSWNRIKNYVDVKNAFFIFDEEKICGFGAWSKAFLKIVKHNDWIILSATPGDTYMDYCNVFIANGFYKNKTEFCREHVVYSRFTKYPKIDRYINTGRLNYLRNKILIDMKFNRHTVPHDEDVYVKYDTTKYTKTIRTRWNPYTNEPIQQPAGLCYALRRIVNEDISRQLALLEIYEKHPKMIIFYSFDYELDILLNLAYGNDVIISQYNGHVHDPLPEGDKWVYIVNYNACEAWNALTTDTIVFYSQTYSYKTLKQAKGRIDRLTTPFTDLYYYHLKTRSGIDLGIARALREKKNFNEEKWVKW